MVHSANSKGETRITANPQGGPSRDARRTRLRELGFGNGGDQGLRGSKVRAFKKAGKSVFGRKP